MRLEKGKAKSMMEDDDVTNQPDVFKGGITGYVSPCQNLNKCFHFYIGNI